MVTFATEVTAGTDTLLRQAPMTAEEYLDAAIKAIDQRFGDGYAKRHPELIVGFMQACAVDFMTTLVKVGFQDIRTAINDHAFVTGPEDH